MTLTTEVPSDGVFVGRVMHHRLRPFRQRFTYRVWTLFVDLEHLQRTASGLRLFGYNRRHLVSFFDADHGPRDGSPLLPWARQQLAAAGIEGADGPIKLLAFPRVLGYVFNPLSVYYCYAQSGELRGLIYEVKNTFGGQHIYVFPVDPEQPLRHGCDKDFYVSPFIGMAAHYRFSLERPGDHLRLVIRETLEDQPQLIASLSGDRRALSDAMLARLIARFGLVTFGVIAGIHWQALKLWWRGARFEPPSRHPPQVVAGNTSFVTPAASPGTGRQQ